MYGRNRKARLLTGGIVGVPPGYGDEHWGDVTLLLNGSDPTDDRSNANQGTSITNNGSVSSASVTGPTAYGTVDALSFGGATQYLTTSHYGSYGATRTVSSLFNQDFTIEGWFNLDASQSNGVNEAASEGTNDNPYPALFSFRQTGLNGIMLYIKEYDQTGYYRLAVGKGLTAAPWWILDLDSGVRYDTGWQHMAVTRSDNTYRVFKNGTLIATGTASDTVTDTGEFTLMSGLSDGNGDHALGDVFDFRITEGIARYTADFTPPTARLPTHAPIVGRRRVEETDNSIEYLIVGGGGGGGKGRGGGGGGGGLLTGTVNYSGPFTLTVGAGGAGATSSTNWGSNGGNSEALGLTAYGGGGGGTNDDNTNGYKGRPGGSGGGSAIWPSGIASIAPAKGKQGNNGAVNPDGWANVGGGGGGGGAGATGGSPSASSQKAGNGGAGSSSSITGTSVVYAGGGGGGGQNYSTNNISGGNGGSGGGGAGGFSGGGASGTVNRGGGGGGGGVDSSFTFKNGGNGGSGVVILRVPQTVTLTSSDITVPTPVIITGTGDHYYKFTTVGSGTVTASGIPAIPKLRTRGYIGAAPVVKNVEVLLIGGGGGGGGGRANGNGTGGGGAGQVVYLPSQGFTSDVSITIGTGGSGGGYDTQGSDGGTTSYGGITANGGGGGARASSSGTSVSGGSGGGGGAYGSATTVGGTGAFSGGTGTPAGNSLYRGGGGGGSAGNGADGAASGNGGIGTSAYSAWATATSTGIGGAYAGGGGAGAYTTAGAGAAGGGAGGAGSGSGSSAAANTGSGGGGGGWGSTTSGNGANGGSGLVLVRYSGSPVLTGGTVVQSGGYTYHKFTADGTLAAGNLSSSPDVYSPGILTLYDLYSSPSQLLPITTGLVLHLEAGETSSYPGSGSTWYDLSDSGYRFTAESNRMPTFTTDASGIKCFQFTTGSKFFDSTTNSPFSGNSFDVTVIAVVNQTTTGNFRTVLGQNGTGSTHGGMSFLSASGQFATDQWKPTGRSMSSAASTNTVQQVAWTVPSWSTHGTSTKIYVDGTEQTTAQYGTGETPSLIAAPFRVGSWMADRTNNDMDWRGNIYAIYVYDRELSASEIQQVFDATKGRYGIS